MRPPLRPGPNPRAATAQRQVRQGPGSSQRQVGGADQEAHQGSSQVAHFHVLARYVPRFETLGPAGFVLALINYSFLVAVMLGFVIFGGLVFEALSRFFGL